MQSGKKLLRRIQGDNWRNRIILGDAHHVLSRLPDASVSLIVTSPPYAEKRKNVYGGVCADQYVEWFLPIAKELFRVLDSTGSFVLNIKEGAVGGQRHSYVIELILALQKQGWLWTEEYIWCKQNSFPGKWPNRFRDAWERCLHFTKQRKFSMFQEQVMVPMGDWHKERFRSDKPADANRNDSKVGNTLTRKVTNWRERELAYPTNVLSLPTECRNQGHAAAFPIALPEWFIKLFTLPGDTILDPFVGSGTTALAAKRLDRNFVGIELLEEYAQHAVRRVCEGTSSEILERRVHRKSNPKVAKPVGSDIAPAAEKRTSKAKRTA